MYTKPILILLGNIIACLLYMPIVKGIWQKKIEQSFATWILWLSLDSIALAGTIVERGNYDLLACYCTGATAVSITLVIRRQFKWTSFESFTLGLVIICLYIWSIGDPKTVIVASTVAVFIAGLPQAKDLWQKPDSNTGRIYIGYVLANGSSCLGGKSWTIEERFYPGLCTILCLIIAIAAFRNKPKVIEAVVA